MQRKRVFHKFKAISVNDDGNHFSSKLEHRYFKQLQLRQKAGEVLFFLRQVPFHLSSCKYVVDFVVFNSNGEVEFVDVKGMDTPISSLKQKQVEATYPVNIKIIRKGDF